MRTKEELDAIKAEVETMKMNLAELNEDELRDVVGGSFCDRGKTWSSDPPHYLIVTALYDCPGFWHEDPDGRGVYCGVCKYSHYSFPTLYCHKRTYDNDPYR